MSMRLRACLPAFWAGVRKVFRVADALPCVGLVVVGGCLSFLITPDDSPPLKPSEGGNPLLPTVVIDPGHGGNDEGTMWRGLAERDLTLDVGVRLEKILQDGGFSTLMTRRENVYVSLPERVRMANEFQDAVFVSIHFNSDRDGASSGIQTHYPKNKEILDPEWSWIGFFPNSKVELPLSEASETLAGDVESALINRTAARNRGIHANDFYVIHHTRCPSVLVEGGFVSNVFEAQLLRNDEYRERLAEGIAEGVMTYVKSRPRPATPPPHLVQDVR
jgi:N-acetylmuramoyl-L-alanine amidase